MNKSQTNKSHPDPIDRELTIDHQRTLKDLQEERLFEARAMETRDAKNTQEIQTLHKKCRILTNLFEEMRMRYERREPRQEDLQQIEELKSVIESQDRDLRLLTERLREMQLQERELLQQQQQQPPPQPPRRAKNRNKPQQQQQQQSQQPMIVEDCEPLPVPIVCDVIYEENEAELIQEEQEDQQQQQPPQQIVVDVPESVIQTETNQVHSTEPVIVQAEVPQQQAEITPEIPVIAIEQIPESTPQPLPAVQAPTITITEEGGNAEPASEVDICEVTVELPVKPSKNPPAEPVSEKVQNMPEMIVVRVPDVAVEAAAVAAAMAAEAIVSAPGPRSSST